MKNNTNKLLKLSSLLLIISSIIFLILTLVDKSNNISLPLCIITIIISNLFLIINKCQQVDIDKK